MYEGLNSTASAATLIESIPKDPDKIAVDVTFSNEHCVGGSVVGIVNGWIGMTS